MKNLLIAIVLVATTVKAQGAEIGSRQAIQEAKLLNVQAKLDEMKTQIDSLNQALKAQKTTNENLAALINTKLDMKAPSNNCFGTANGYQLCIQSDGNLVVYKPNGTSGWNSWASDAAINAKANASSLDGKVDKGTSCMPGGEFSVCMQADGNLVVYRAGVAYWSSFTGKLR